MHEMSAMEIDVVTPVHDHADEIRDVIVQSIVELCTKDHKNNPEIILRWIEGKTPKAVTSWIDNPKNRMRAAIRRGRVLGVGCVTLDGKVILNYVRPEARFRGISKAVMEALESQARSDGNVFVTLESTTTALDFYYGLGYRSRSEPGTKFGLTTWPLIKRLTA